MARDNYFNQGDAFSNFHRARQEKIAYVDIDCVPCCKNCYEPLALFETVFDKGQTYKNTTVVQKLARKSSLPGFLVYYKVKADNKTIEHFRISQLQPVQTEEFLLLPDVFVSFLVSLQEEHRKDCEME
jgi:hypothetical protein